eukprot:Rmarinus@m.353
MTGWYTHRSPSAAALGKLKMDLSEFLVMLEKVKGNALQWKSVKLLMSDKRTDQPRELSGPIVPAYNIPLNDIKLSQHITMADVIRSVKPSFVAGHWHNPKYAVTPFIGAGCSSLKQLQQMWPYRKILPFRKLFFAARNALVGKPPDKWCSKSVQTLLKAYTVLSLVYAEAWEKKREFIVYKKIYNHVQFPNPPEKLVHYVLGVQYPGIDAILIADGWENIGSHHLWPDGYETISFEIKDFHKYTPVKPQSAKAKSGTRGRGRGRGRGPAVRMCGRSAKGSSRNVVYVHNRGRGCRRGRRYFVNRPSSCGSGASDPHDKSDYGESDSGSNDNDGCGGSDDGLSDTPVPAKTVVGRGQSATLSPLAPLSGATVAPHPASASPLVRDAGPCDPRLPGVPTSPSFHSQPSVHAHDSAGNRSRNGSMGSSNCDSIPVGNNGVSTGNSFDPPSVHAVGGDAGEAHARDRHWRPSTIAVARRSARRSKVVPPPKATLPAEPNAMASRPQRSLTSEPSTATTRPQAPHPVSRPPPDRNTMASPLPPEPNTVVCAPVLHSEPNLPSASPQAPRALSHLSLKPRMAEVLRPPKPTNTNTTMPPRPLLSTTRTRTFLPGSSDMIPMSGSLTCGTPAMAAGGECLSDSALQYPNLTERGVLHCYRKHISAVTDFCERVGIVADLAFEILDERPRGEAVSIINLSYSPEGSEKWQAKVDVLAELAMWYVEVHRTVALEIRICPNGWVSQCLRRNIPADDKASLLEELSMCLAVSFICLHSEGDRLGLGPSLTRRDQRICLIPPFPFPVSPLRIGV